MRGKAKHEEKDESHIQETQQENLMIECHFLLGGTFLQKQTNDRIHL